MNNEPYQKRWFERVPVSLSVSGTYRTKIFQKYSFTGKSQNVSYDGLCVEAGTNGFKAGQKIILKTQLYAGDFLTKIIGKICWVGNKDDSQESINLGIQLIRTRHYDVWCKKVDEALISSSS